MNIDVSTIVSQNITTAYDSIDLSSINTSKLKTLLNGASAVMDTPDMIVAVYPAEQVFIQLADNRIRVTLQKETKDIGQVPLWKIASGCHLLVSRKSKLNAYGFNYDIGIMTGDDARITTQDLFLPNVQEIESVLQGHIFNFSPRFKFERNNVEYDLLLEPIDDQRIKAHLNVHFPKKTLPGSRKLETSFFQEYNYLISTLPNLLRKR